MTAAKTSLTVGIADINVGIRHRRDLGDIEGLAASIADVGLLHPVVININNKLIAGARRLKACRQLGWSSVPVHVVDIDAIARGELDENSQRKNFTPSELVAIAETVEQRERELARERMTLGKISTGSERGKVRDRIAAPLGVSGRTLEKAKAVVEAAEAEPDNEKIAKLVEAMDKSGRVNGPYQRLKIMKQAEAIRAEPPPLPGNGPYRVASCDVPWPSEPDDPDPSERGYWPFPTMSIEQLCKLPVSSIMHADSVLWFWTTNFHMVHAYRILDAWGFHRRPTIMTWAKDRPGRGQRLHGQTEHAIMAIRGNPVITLTNQTTLLRAPALKPLGTKPPEFYDRVEKLCPAPRYAELFARQPRARWDGHGDEYRNPAAATGVEAQP